MSEANISVPDSQTLLTLFGTRDQHLRRIRDALPVRVAARDGEIIVEGDDVSVARATDIIEKLKEIIRLQGSLSSEDVAGVLDASSNGKTADATPNPTIELGTVGRKIQPRTPGQVKYVNSIHKNDVVFCVGPAGTGKTYLAVAMAVQYLRQERVKRIVLVRPAVEAGESLGYLPGDLQAKINPYLRPLLDALREMINWDEMKRYQEQDIIEVAPLAYMRGRTLNDAFIILDEAQNTTVAQMKMFLTRMGRGSKIIVSGDATQIDLPPRTPSGLIDAQMRLQGIEGLAHIMLNNTDIVRHKLVQDIVRAYEEESRQ